MPLDDLLKVNNNIKKETFHQRKLSIKDNNLENPVKDKHFYCYQYLRILLQLMLF